MGTIGSRKVFIQGSFESNAEDVHGRRVHGLETGGTPEAGYHDVRLLKRKGWMSGWLDNYLAM